jgi:hypothetical protein
MSEIYSRSLKRTPAALDRVMEFVNVYGPQTKIDVIENAVYVPGRFCLYDKNGIRIESSVFWRDKHYFAAPFWPPSAIERIEIPEDLEVCDETIMYLSVLVPQWGHFCTESIARLWAAKYLTDPSIKFFWPQMDENIAIDSYVFEFLELLSITPDRLISFKSPILIKNAIIPHASGRHEAEYYSNHTDIFKLIARKIIGDTLPELCTQPVYLSRSNFRIDNYMHNNNRTFFNEIEFENILRSHGVRIVYPEQLNLSEKIILFNTHSIFFGPRASAFYALFFSLRPQEQQIHLFLEQRDIYDYRDFLAADKLTGIKSFYISLIFQYVGDLINQPTDGVGPDFQIDIPQALAWLSNSGVLRSVGLSSPGATMAAINGSVDIFNDHGLAAGRRYSGRPMTAICIDVHGPAVIEYAIDNGSQEPHTWVTCGSWAGIRGHPILGVAFRLKDKHIFSLKYLCTFVGFNEAIWSDGDEILRSPIGSPLEAFQLFLIPPEQDMG